MYDNDEFKGVSIEDLVESDIIEKGHYEEIKAFCDAVIKGGEWPIPLWQQIQASKIALKVEEQIATRDLSS